MKYPETHEQAVRILNAVRAGAGRHIPVPIINWCLALTGDLVE